MRAFRMMTMMDSVSVFTQLTCGPIDPPSECTGIVSVQSTLPLGGSSSLYELSALSPPAAGEANRMRWRSGLSR